MQKLQFSGTVVRIDPVQTFPSGFSKRRVIIDDDPDGRYPNPVPFDASKDRIALLDGIRPGQAVTASFCVRGRAWNGRDFCDLSLLGIVAAPAPDSPGAPPDPIDPLPPPPPPPGPDDPIPF